MRKLSRAQELSLFNQLLPLFAYGSESVLRLFAAACVERARRVETILTEHPEMQEMISSEAAVHLDIAQEVENVAAVARFTIWNDGY